MAGLPWVRLDASFPTNPKVLQLLEMREGHRAGFVYLCALAYCGAHGTDGVVSAGALPFIHGRRADVQKLVEVGLWHDYPDGGWIINGWDEKQVTNEAARLRSAMAKRAAAARWRPGKEDTA